MSFSILFFEFFLCFRFVGSDCEDNEDEKENNERRSSDGIGGNSQEYVHPPEEDDKGTDRVANRPQVSPTR